MAFNWTQLALAETVPGFNPESHAGEAMIAVATLGIVSLIAVGLAAMAKRDLGKGEVAVLPSDRLSIRGIFEGITELVSGLADMVIGQHGKFYVPMFAAIFYFVLINNLFGTIPGMTPATENLNTTLAFGVFVFIAYNYFGIKEQGFVSYMKHFMGPVIWLAPLMFIVEVVSHVVRPVSLGLRLANVMSGDHKVLSTFLDLTPAFIPMIFYAMGLFVAVLQAFVFTLLSMVYVALATAHEEEH